MQKLAINLNDIPAAVQAYAEKIRYGVVRDLVGHGIGEHPPRGSGSALILPEEEKAASDCRPE